SIADANIAYDDLGVGMDAGGNDPEGRGRRVARDDDVDRVERSAASNHDVQSVHLDRRALRLEKALGMVPGRGGLDEMRCSGREGAREQQAGFDLGACDRQSVLDAVKVAAADGEGQVIVVLTTHRGRSHGAERIDDAIHWAGAERLIPGEYGQKRL